MQVHIDGADRARIWGWAWHPERPGARARLQVLVNGAPVGEITADVLREDLRDAQISDGHAAFDFHFPAPLPAGARQVLALRCAETGEMPPAGQRELPAILGLTEEAQEALRGAIRAALDAVSSRAEIATLAGLLHAEAEAIAGNDARAAALGRIALVLDDRVPRADRDAGSQAILSHMRALQRRGLSVVFVPTSPVGGDAQGAAAMAEEGMLCLEPAGTMAALRGFGAVAEVVYLHRLSSARDWLVPARRFCPAARIVYAIADLHYLRLERQQAVLGRAQPVAAVRAAEYAAMAAADAVLTHSEAEARIIAAELPGVRVHVVPWEIPPAPVATPFAQRRGVAFIGSFGHPPNRDAAVWLVDRVMRIVWAEAPEIPCLLAGSDMPEGLFAGVEGNLRVLGHVATTAEVFEQVRLTAAPLRWGAGLKGKVLDSLAAGLPCVASTVAMEGIAVPAALADCVADDPLGMAIAILRLHEDAEANVAAAAAGLGLIAAGFARGVIDAGLAGVLAE